MTGSNFFSDIKADIQSFIDTPLLGELQAALVDSTNITNHPWLDNLIPATLTQAVVDTIDWLESTTPPGAGLQINNHFVAVLNA